jgi:PAS domain S-box-containing protein
MRDFPNLLGQLAQKAVGKKTEEFQITITRKNGEKRLLEVDSTTLKKNGLPVGFLAIARDITERKTMEESLKESEERLKKLIEYAPDAIYMNDLQGNFMDGNKQAEELTGYKKDELIGKSFLKLRLLPKKRVPQAAKLLAKSFMGHKTGPDEFELVRKDGGHIFVEISTFPVRRRGKVEVIGIARDITERKAMETKLKEYAEHLEDKVQERNEELKKAQEQLLEAEKLAAIGKVAAMVGHDLRNPLQSIENAAYYLNNELPFLSSLPDPQKTMEMLHVINNSVNYADKIIRDLQDFSRTRAIVLRKVDVNHIVEDTLQQIQIPKNVELRTEMGNIPEIEVDVDQITRVFMNLAVNGIQAMENRGTLTISTRQTKDFAEITFKDTGVGIPKEKMDRIFTPFSTTKAKGMGMGLPICRKFVENHGGTIKVESEVGKGTIVAVKLPVHKK